ncbi:putative membrane protein [Streptomyces sp. 3211.6]|uniref:anthrone oxygenase family protein n=1 Tax=Streptomyces TaxID=1883 RepID=UPI0009A4D904|nr:MULTISPECIES: anthrone oxygenase family protein [Streptomyces]RKS97055.1 putative membrane protein [Streptomyces sp. 3211.6]RPF25418.1 putative membrane protein [Streptomyces sp. Ag109_G2-6]
METARFAALIAATITTGLVSGLFYGFTVAVMPGLRTSGDRTVVEAMQRINVAILNGWFLLGYVGALVFTGLALALQLAGDGGGGATAPLAGAFAAYLLAVVVTARVNIPLNNALAQAGPVEDIADPAAVRRAFEGPWVRANTGRTVLCAAAFGLLVWALALHGQP